MSATEVLHGEKQVGTCEAAVAGLKANLKGEWDEFLQDILLRASQAKATQEHIVGQWLSNGGGGVVGVCPIAPQPKWAADAGALAKADNLLSAGQVVAVGLPSEGQLTARSAATDRSVEVISSIDDRLREIAATLQHRTSDPVTLHSFLRGHGDGSTANEEGEGDVRSASQGMHRRQRETLQEAKATLSKRTSHQPTAMDVVDSQVGSADVWDVETMDHMSCLKRRLFRFISKYRRWARNLREPSREGILHRVLLHEMFETTCALVIVLNGIFTIYTTNYEMDHLRRNTSTPVVATEAFFLVFYTLELAIKFAVHRLFFFISEDVQWNLFDLSLVLFSIVDWILSEVVGDSSMSITFMRALRVLKMSKILRGLRVMKFFTELRLMLNSLLGSLTYLFWSLVMLLLIFYIFGLVFVQGAASFLLSNRERLEQMEVTSVYDHFGSVQGAMFTLYLITTGGEDWGVFYKVTEVIGTFEQVILLVFVAFIQIALLNILTGIFVENALKLAQPDRDVLALEHRKKMSADADALRRLFISIGNESGTLKMDDFSEHLMKASVLSQLAMLGLDVRDARLFFGMLASASESQEVDIRTFVDGCMRLKGQASSIDMQGLVFEARQIHKTLRSLQLDFEERFHAIWKSLPAYQVFSSMHGADTLGEDDRRSRVADDGGSGGRNSQYQAGSPSSGITVSPSLPEEPSAPIEQWPQFQMLKANL